METSHKQSVDISFQMNCSKLAGEKRLKGKGRERI